MLRGQILFDTVRFSPPTKRTVPRSIGSIVITYKILLENEKLGSSISMWDSNMGKYTDIVVSDTFLMLFSQTPLFHKFHLSNRQNCIGFCMTLRPGYFNIIWVRAEGKPKVMGDLRCSTISYNANRSNARGNIQHCITSLH